MTLIVRELTMNIRQIALAVCVSIPPPALADCTTGPVTVIGKNDYPPISFTKENKLIGLGYSVIKQIAKSKGLDTTVSTPAPWKRVVHRGRIGKVDIIIGLRSTNLSKDHFVFLPTPIMESAQYIIFLKGNELRTKEDLKGLHGGVLSGTTFTTEFEKYAKDNLSIAPVRTTKQNLLKLNSGRIDYFIAPLLPVIHLIETTGMKMKIKFTPIPLFSVSEYIAISKKSNCISMQETLETGLKEQIKNGYIDQEFEFFSKDWDVLDYMK